MTPTLIKQQLTFNLIGIKGLERVVADCYLNGNTLMIIICLDSDIDAWKVKLQIEALIKSPYRCVYTFLRKRSLRKKYNPDWIDMEANMKAVPPNTFFAKKPDKN